MVRCVQIAIARSAEHDIRQSDQSLVCHFQDDSWKRDPREFRWTSDSPPILENCGAGYFPGRDHRFRSAHHRSAYKNVIGRLTVPALGLSHAQSHEETIRNDLIWIYQFRRAAKGTVHAKVLLTAPARLAAWELVSI
jgi:hypothetical protein